MLLIGLARIGKDPAIRYTGDGKPVMDLSLAMDYGKKGADGKKTYAMDLRNHVG